MESLIIGCIDQTIAKQIGRKPGNVEVDKSAIDHIGYHSVELAQLGMTPIEFAYYVLQNYNEIRKGQKTELFLIVRNGLPKVAIIRMDYVRGIYRIETATVMRTDYLNKKELLWKK